MTAKRSVMHLLMAVLVCGLVTVAEAAPAKKVTKENTEKAEWQFKPSIYSRGGLTYGLKLDRYYNTNNQTFNLGNYADETDGIRPNLTEAQVVFSYKKNIRYTYGFDVQNNQRMAQNYGNQRPLQERLNFLEYIDGNNTYWFGQRAYRGDGEYLTGKWFLDELNILGGGVQIAKIAPNLNFELAYGTTSNDNNNLNNEISVFPENVLANKLEYALTNNSKVKTNIELHRINGPDKANRAWAYVVGGEYKRWGDQFKGGKLYNRVVLNYSKGPIGGTMGVEGGGRNLGHHFSKLLVSWNGDYKNDAFKGYYTLVYQGHADGKAKWRTLDIYLRPMYNVKGNFYAGLDYAGRTVISRTNATFARDADHVGAYRIALMGEYKPNWQETSFRVLIGRMSHNERVAYAPNSNKKAANFIRLGYEVQIN